MNYKKFPNNFLELVDSQSNYEESKAVILSVPYEKTTTFLEGTKKGPKAMLEASVGVQLYDEEIGKDICNIGICTLNPLTAEKKAETMLDKIYDKVKKLIDDGKFPVVVGGEHTISSGCVRAFAEKHKDDPKKEKEQKMSINTMA